MVAGVREFDLVCGKIRWEVTPGKFFDATSSSVARPLIGKRTTVPSRLISSAVGLVQTSETRCPASNTLVLNNEP